MFGFKPYNPSILLIMNQIRCRRMQDQMPQNAASDLVLHCLLLNEIVNYYLTTIKF